MVLCVADDVYPMVLGRGYIPATVEMFRPSDDDGKQMVTTVFEGRHPETQSEREARIRRLASLVKQGSYLVKSQLLATALLEWDPRRVATRAADADAPERRRAYMREYMRRRRVGGDQLARLDDDVGDAIQPSATGPPGLTGLPGP